MARIKEIVKIIDNNTLRFSCEECEGEFLDTKVTINGTLLCWITFSELDQFVTEFSTIIGKYRI